MKAETEGKFMVLRENKDGDGKEGKEESADGYTLGGDISFYEWEYKSNTQQKNQGE